MLPIQRRQQILEWLEVEGVLAVRIIGERLNVSDMTVYRDIKPLLESGEVIKTSGGIALYEQEEREDSKVCSYCLKESESRLNVQIVTTKRVEKACCFHCALLRYEQIKDDITQILCRDFLQDVTISAKTATLIVNPEINLNCCYPQVVPFASKKQAMQFQKGFDGELHTFESALNTIKEEMNPTCCCVK